MTPGEIKQLDPSGGQLVDRSGYWQDKRGDRVRVDGFKQVAYGVIVNDEGAEVPFLWNTSDGMPADTQYHPIARLVRPWTENTP